MITIRRTILGFFIILFFHLITQLGNTQHNPLEGLDSYVKHSTKDTLESAYLGKRSPTILIDAAHHNALDLVESHGAWLEEEGFKINILKRPFDHESLVSVDVVISATPSAERNAVTKPYTEEMFARAWQPPFPSAFSAHEISVLHKWVEEGGGLMLVFDHTPVSNAVEELAAAFGVEVANGHAFDEKKLHWDNDSLIRKGAGNAFFRRAEGTLAAHPITAGRSAGEKIDLVVLGGGAAFHLPAEGLSLLTLGVSFVSFNPEIPFRFRKDTPRQPIGGWSQGGVLRVGRGRLVVFGDAGILVTPEEPADFEPPWNVWQKQNPQLFLNALRWLSSQLNKEL